MKIIKIAIKGLFGNTKTINLNIKNSSISIIHSPNGFGKTTILNLIKDVIEGKLKLLNNVLFKSITITFDRKSKINIEDFYSITVRKIQTKLELQTKESNIEIIQYKDNENNKFILNPLYYNNFNDSFEEYNWYDSSENYESFNELEYLQTRDKARRELYNFNRFIEELKKDIIVKMINTNRLYLDSLNEDDKNLINLNNSNDKPHFLAFEEEHKNTESIIAFVNDLSKRINDVKKMKEEISEDLDSSFPLRLIENNNTFNSVIANKNLHELVDKRKKLSDIGLISSNDKLQMPTKIQEKWLSVLDLYISDNIKKLSVYDNLYEHLNLFLSLLNDLNRYSNKKAIITTEGLKFVINNKKEREIPIENLSSGEKHLFILLYYLIFLCDHNNTLILIDEPEISMHIAWQSVFIDNLLKICLLKNSQAFVTTHSPNIANGHFDMMINLNNKKIEKKVDLKKDDRK